MSSATPNTTPKTSKPSEKLEVKNSANIKHDKDATQKVPEEVSRKDASKASSSHGASSKKTVTSSWASSYLHSIGHGTKPIKLNLSLSRSRTTQKTESMPIKSQKSEPKTNVTSVNMPQPPTPQPKSTGFKPRMDTKTWLTQTSLKNNSEDEDKIAATFKHDLIRQSEPYLNAHPITDSSAPRLDTSTQLNKQPETKFINMPSKSINTSNAENIHPHTQSYQDKNNNSTSHSTPYVDFTPLMETVRQASQNTFGPHIQSYYNNVGLHSAPYASYSPYMGPGTWPIQASYANPIHNSYDYMNYNSLNNNLLSNQSTTYGNLTNYTDTVSWQTHSSYTNTIHSNYKDFNTTNISKPLFSEHSYSNNTSYTTAYVPHIDTVTRFNQVPHDNPTHSAYENINSSYLTEHSLNEHDRTYSNHSHKFYTSSRPCNDIVTWLTQLMSGTNENINTNLSQSNSEYRHAELSSNKTILIHSDEIKNISNYDTSKNASKERDVNMSQSNKNIASHSVDTETCIVREKSAIESPKRENKKFKKSVTKEKRSHCSTKNVLISSSKNKTKDTEAACVNNSVASEQSKTKKKLERETAKLEARLKAVNLKIMALMSKTGSASKPGSTSNTSEKEQPARSKQKNTPEVKKEAETKSVESSERNLPENKDQHSLKKKVQSDKIRKQETLKTLKRNSRSPENKKKKRRRSTTEEEISLNANKVTRSSSRESRENLNSLRKSRRKGNSSKESTKKESTDIKSMKRRKGTSENETKSSESPPKKRVRNETSLSPKLKQKISEASSAQNIKKDINTKGICPVKSVIKLPEMSQLKHPRIKPPESESADVDYESNFDLRSRLSKRIPYSHQSKEKIETARENLVITINGNGGSEGNQEANNKTPTPIPESSQTKPKSKKYKKIQLIIKVLCQDQEDSSENSSEDEKPSDSIGAQNVDSFLDDFNVDEIVNSLKQSPKCDTKNQDNCIVDQQITLAEDNEIKKMSVNSTRTFVQPITIKKEIKTEIIDDEEIQSDSFNNSGKSLENLNKKATGDIRMTEPSICKGLDNDNNKTNNQETTIKINEQVNEIKIKEEYDADVFIADKTKSVPSLNENMDQIVKPSVRPKLDSNIQVRTEFHSDVTLKTKENMNSLIQVTENAAALNLTKIKKENDVSEDKNIQCAPSLNKGPKLGQNIQIGTEFHPDDHVKTNNNLEASIQVNETDIDLIKIKKENDTVVLEDNQIKYLPSINDNVDQIVNTFIEPKLDHIKSNEGQGKVENESPVPDNEASSKENDNEDYNNETNISTDLKTYDSDAETIKMVDQQECDDDNSVATLTTSVENNMESDNTSSTSNKAEKRSVKIVMSQADQLMANQLENWVLQYLHKDITVTSIIHKGRFSNIFKTMDTRGEFNAVKIMKIDNTQLRVEKTAMYRDVQKDVPKENLNTVYFINGFSIGRNWCFLMEYYPKNLQDVLFVKMLNIDRVQTLARQLVSAVMLLRHNNIVHSDIIPHHILIDASNQRLKLAGFDSAYYSGTRKALPNIGTVCYRAPEIIIGFSASFSIDVWSTAVIMYQMVTGMKLFSGYFNNDILYQQMCTFGCLPSDMVLRSAYGYKHFSGQNFMKRSGNNGQTITYIRMMHLTRSIQKIMFSSYNRKWRSKRTPWQISEDMSKLNLVHDLLSHMFTLDPRARIPIEHVYTHSFIYESMN